MRNPSRWQALIVLLGAAASTADGAVILRETFADDPIAAGRAAVVTGDAARFHFADGAMSALYDTSLPTAKLAWPLAEPLDASLDFRLHATVLIHSDGLFADPNRFAQLAFGLINSSSTGNDRAGGEGGSAFEVVTIDYFPNISPIFGGPSLGPTVIGADSGSGFFSSIQFPFGDESELNDEGPLPLDAPLTFELEYLAAASLLSLRVSTMDAALPINANQPDQAPGGLDGDSTTIQLLLDPGTPFQVDQFAIPLWEDTFLANGAQASVQALLEFHEIVVERILPGVPGDTNGDGVVAIDDLNNVRNTFGETGAAPAGDTYPEDGLVDLHDLNRVRNNFGAGAVAPEPAAAPLAAAGLAALIYHGVRTRTRLRPPACPTIVRPRRPPSWITTAARGTRASPGRAASPGPPPTRTSSTPCATSTASAGSATASRASACSASAPAAESTA